MPHTHKHKLFLFIVVFILLLALFFNGQTVTASCPEPGSSEEEYQKSDAVFSGYVMSMSGVNGLLIDGVTYFLVKIGFHSIDFYQTLFPGIKVVFVVETSWKGVDTSSVTIRIGYDNRIASGGHLEVGRKYLVYASHAYGDPEKYLLTGPCHSTQLYSSTSDDMVYLNNLPTLPLKNFPAILRTIDISDIFIILLVAGLVYVLKRNKSLKAHRTNDV